MVGRRNAGAATYDAAPNIALVKYWGMRDVARGLPMNSSISVTLDRLRTRTTVRFDPALRADLLVMNGVGTGGAPLVAVRRFLDQVRRLTRSSVHAEVVTANNFPTASGLASSASGFAALAGAASHAAGLRLSDRALSRLARLGSGSASRSIFGGFVEWRAGRRGDGSDCYAVQMFGPDHWPALVDVVVLVAGAPVKTTRSAEAMQRTVATSPRYAARQRGLPTRLARIRTALRERDAPGLFDLVMDECDDFRAVCETTRPSLDYLTPVSRRILEAVRALNVDAGRTVAGYTHDAGAHLHIFTLDGDASRLRRRLSEIDGITRVLTLHAGSGGHLVRGPTARLS